MRKILLVGLCLVNFFGAYAQNKTLGVGVATPNPNAALHVESPGGNQGFLMPRLTTAQRLAMNALLTAGDKGLMLYDTDQNAVYIWDGLVWGTPSEVENLDPTSTSDAFTVLNTGKGSAARLTTNNTTSKMPVLWAETNSDSAQSAPIYGLNTGTGDVAASFRIANTASNKPALYVESNGTGRVASFIRTGTGGGATVFANVKNTGHGFWSEHEGTNGYAAILQSVNASNPNPAVFVEALGSGPSFFTQKSQTTSTGDGILSEHLGTSGAAARFIINNAENSSAGIVSTTNGRGSAVRGENTGAADGFAGTFDNTNPTNTFPAIQASTAGNGSGVRVMQTAGTGPGMDVFMHNTGSNATGIAVDQTGLGTGGSFVINNAASNASALYVNTLGLGDGGFFQIDNATSNNTAVKGRAINTSGGAGAFEIFNSTNSKAAVFATTNGVGNAGNFNVNNGLSNVAALFSSTNGTGSALEAATSTGFTAIYGRHDGTGDGNAGLFQITNAGNTYPALQVNTAGDGAAINAVTDGTGGAASFHNNNGGSGAATLFSSNAGTGPAIQGQTASGFTAILGRQEGMNGTAARFEIVNASNGSAAVEAITPGPGPAIRASNDSKGIAFAIWSGGIQVTTEDITASSIANRASAYRITGTNTTFTLDFGPVNGEVFLIINDTANPITISGGGSNITLLSGEGKTFIMFPGALRAF